MKLVTPPVDEYLYSLGLKVYDSYDTIRLPLSTERYAVQKEAHK
jgi:hypothetical protein